MKIIHVIPNLKRGGAERLCLDICNELRKQDHDVQIIIFKNEIEYDELIQDLNVNVIPSTYQPSIFKPDIIDVNLLQDFIKKANPDVIHSHLYEADSITFQLELSSTTQLISHIHSNRKELIKFDKTRSIKEKIVSKFERNIYKKHLTQLSVKQIAISKDCLNFALNDLGQPSSNVILLKNCIDFNKFKSEPKHIDYSTQPINLISLGRFDENKSQSFLIKVAKKLKSLNINFNITFIGGGPELDKVKSLTQEYKLDNQVKFLGMVSNPEVYLKKAHIFIHAAKKEAFGLALIEAMAAGLPVISTDGFGNRDIIQENKNGFMILNRSVDEFCKKIRFLSENPKSYNEISKYSIEFASNFDVSNYVDNLINVYNNPTN